jgi:adenylate cyclase
MALPLRDQGLPSGTITFLFTDIEGSTKTWETHGEAMRFALARHDSLIRGCVENHSGHVLKSTGDGFLSVFSTAPDAMRAAISCQVALHSETWPAPLALRARMAIHTGAAELRDGDYFGPTLNRAARLMSLGHGGQTLLSRASHDLCCDALPAGVTLDSLGEHSLKDLARRETVFQLCHPDLPRDFPGLAVVAGSIDERTPSIAVLPFADMSKGGESEYFADGLAEELLNSLSKVAGLRVASRTSAFSFKGSNADIPAIAGKLKVEHILEGSIRTAGDRVRITAQLVHARTDAHLWSNTYDRDLADVFAVQDEIAGIVARELGARLLGAPKGRATNLEAHRLYLQGRYFTSRVSEGDSAKALDFAQRSVEADPAFALGWAGLSRVHTNMANSRFVPLEAGYRNARDAARRALHLEPDLAEGHAALGRVQLFHDWDWAAAKASFEKALELAPGNGDVARHAAVLEAAAGRGDEAIALCRRAVLLDPLGVFAHADLGTWCMNFGLFDEAEASMRVAHELNEQGPLTNGYQGMVQLARGNAARAGLHFQQEADEAFRIFGAAVTLVALGEHEKARAAVRGLRDRFAAENPSLVAAACAYANEPDAAFECLERACAGRDPVMVTVKSQFLFRRIHADLRWPALMQRIGLAPAAD